VWVEREDRWNFLFFLLNFAKSTLKLKLIKKGEYSIFSLCLAYFKEK
jgi:hypothetical protein